MQMAAPPRTVRLALNSIVADLQKCVRLRAIRRRPLVALSGHGGKTELDVAGARFGEPAAAAQPRAEAEVTIELIFAASAAVAGL